MRKSFLLIICLALIVIAPSSVIADNEETEGEDDNRYENAWELTVGVEVILERERVDQLEPGKNEKIADYDETQKRESGTSLELPVYLSYTFEATGTTLFVNASFTDEFITFDGEDFGIEQSLGEYGDISISLGYDIDDVWENPYLLREERDDTRQKTHYIDIAWEEILGTGFLVAYGGERINVKDDVIGDINPDLKRDGSTYQLEAGFAIEFGDDHILTPLLVYTKGRIHGNSNSYDGYGAGLEYEITIEEILSFEFAISVGEKTYDRTHPVFAKTREDNNIDCSAEIKLLDILDCEKFNLYIYAEYESVNSNIDFFNGYTAEIGGGIEYTF